MAKIGKIGIYGGSFNPVHLGHVGLARRAIDELELDRLLIVPAKESPFKTGFSRIISDADRFALVQQAFSSIPKCEVLDIELRRGGISYAVDTVKELQHLYGEAEWFFIIGEDSVAGLERWKDWETLKQLCRFTAYPRTKESSTQIRELLEKGEPIDEFVPAEVAEFFRTEAE